MLVLRVGLDYMKLRGDKDLVMLAIGCIIYNIISIIDATEY